MSCSLCRLPFTPSKASVAPRWPPPGMLSEKQVAYMKFGVGMGQYILGLVIDLVHLDNNLFAAHNSPLMINIAWETPDKTFVAFHVHCAAILRHTLGLTHDHPEAILELTVLEQIIGPTLTGAHAGRFPCINYEDVLGVPHRVDIESLWSTGPSEGIANFNWQEWKARGLEWTAVRPDVFPRFRPTIALSRLGSLDPLPESPSDLITTQSLDVLHIILPYLSDESFVNLLSTCRTLRRHALTTFQPHARERVLALGWAVPTQTEYDSFVKRNSPRSRLSDPSNDNQGDLALEMSQVAMAHAAHSPVDADWQLYLSQVQRSSAMRARKWLWALAEEVSRVYREKKAVSEYADVQTIDEEGNKVTKRSMAWTAWSRLLSEQMVMRDLVMGKLGSAVPLKQDW